jgi:hypothetical protein
MEIPSRLEKLIDRMLEIYPFPKDRAFEHIETPRT